MASGLARFTMQRFKCDQCNRVLDVVIPMKRPLPVPHFRFSGNYESPDEKITIARRRECRGTWVADGVQREEGLDASG